MTPLKNSRASSLLYPTIIFAILLAIASRALLITRPTLHDHFAFTFLSFALLVAPIWFFGFGIEQHLRQILGDSYLRVAVAGTISLPYPIYAVPAHVFRWNIQIGFLVICIAGAALLEAARRQYGSSRGGWQDFVVLAALGLSVDLRFFESAWPSPGMSAMSKLVLVDLALYGYLVIRQLDGVGYDLRPKLVDLGVGLREFCFFAPIAVGLGLGLHFLHWQSKLPSVLTFVGGWLFTFLFIAIPEELFFRGLVQNLLERRWGTRASLAITSVLFGLSHFNKRLGPGVVVGFNWRYVLLATIAGIFYGRAWLSRRRLMASAITHTTVDVVWGTWLR